MPETVGDFLKTKLGNMARWVSDGVGKENLTIDPVAFVAERSALECVVLADAVASHKAVVMSRDWRGLAKLLKDEAVPEEWAVSFACLLHAVKAREDMHDKFWRYMELFRDVIIKSNE
tara:strand:- start:1174 stop:1527 length:354 start_codon:yes stop_codon:yes gene_type:complete